MNEKELQSFKRQLLEEKERLEGEVESFQAEMHVTQSDWGGEHGYENHLADLASDLAARESDMSIEFNAMDLLNRVNEALLRIEDGSFGLCKVCGQPISLERLKAIPWAELCVEDKKKEETVP